jgi:hypothetical protein
VGADCRGRHKEIAVYVEGFANILVIVSDSECLDLMADSAVYEYDDRALAAAVPLNEGLAALGAILWG